MKLRLLLACATLALAAAPAALAQPAPAAPADPAAKQPALERLPAKGGARLTVSSPAFKDGGDMPFENTQYRGNVFPGLAWSAGPAGTKAYAIIMQDLDFIIRGAPILHWTMINIPAGVTKLDPGMSAPPAGAAYGPNILGLAQAYMGPRTPPGPKHHYHFQVFALDAPLPDAAGAGFDPLLAAMKDHVLASGSVVALAQADPTAPPPPPRSAPPPAAPQ